MQRIPLIGVIGDKEEQNDTISIRALDGSSLGNLKLEELFKLVESLINKKGSVN